MPTGSVRRWNFNVDLDELRENTERLNRLMSQLTAHEPLEIKPKSIKELLGKSKTSGLNEFCKKTYKDYSGINK